MPARVISGSVIKQIDHSTIAFSIVTRTLHKFYGKVLHRKSKFLAHIPADLSSSIKAGDHIQVQECAPISKRKTWIVTSKSI